MIDDSPSPLPWAFALALLGGGVILAISESPVSAILAVMIGGGAALLMRQKEEEPIDTAETAPAATATLSIESLIEGISEPLLLCDGMRISRANRAALDLLGAHIVGSDVRLAIRQPGAAARLAVMDLHDRTPLELAGLGTKGQRWEMQIAPLGEEQRLIHLTDRSGAHAAEKMRVDFVANASHELRTPLATILGFVETLADPEAGGDPATRDRFLGIIGKEARRMQALIDELITLSRIEAEKHRTPDETVDIGALGQEVVSVFQAGHGTRGQDLQLKVDANVPAVRGDRAQLSQLLHNLVSNAMKYGGAGKPVTIRIKSAARQGQRSMVGLVVADEGEGIAPEHLPRLTERFYRVDSGRSRAVGGTGLGLAIVKHIVERHRGRLDIESTLGVGTRISVLLPRADETAPS